MLALAGNNPQKAFEIFGEAFRQAYQRGYGVTLPTRQEPVTRTVTRQLPPVITPRTEPPPSFRRMREPKEGEPLYGYEVTPPRTVVEQEPTGEVRTVLALPAPTDPFEEFLARLPDYEIQLPGGQTMSAKDYVRVLRAAGASGRDLTQAFASLFGIMSPSERLEHNWRMFQMEMERARFNWQRYTDEQKLQLQKLEAEATKAYRDTQLAIEQGRLDEARRHNRRLEEIQEQIVRIREREAAAREKEAEASMIRAEAQREERRAADATERALMQAVENARAKLARLQEIERFFQENPSATLARLGEGMAEIVSRQELPALLRQARAELQSRQQALERYRRRITVYETVGGHRLTSEEIIQWIRSALQKGWTREQIRRRLIEHGIPPERFGF